MIFNVQLFIVININYFIHSMRYECGLIHISFGYSFRHTKNKYLGNTYFLLMCVFVIT